MRKSAMNATADRNQPVAVELIGGSCDRHRQVLATAAELDGPHQDLGALLVVDGWSGRALHEPDLPPAPANV
ncbi:hypothetical protein ACSNOI_43780 [Actinomadura kijaniata]|uniref:hypothetical protein n=1 Tax=Actinomadura kijaniata TaxID=46161 RepID=UPI003F1D808B